MYAEAHLIALRLGNIEEVEKNYKNANALFSASSANNPKINDKLPWTVYLQSLGSELNELIRRVEKNQAQHYISLARQADDIASKMKHADQAIKVLECYIKDMSTKESINDANDAYLCNVIAEAYYEAAVCRTNNETEKNQKLEFAKQYATKSLRYFNAKNMSDHNFFRSNLILAECALAQDASDKSTKVTGVFTNLLQRGFTGDLRVRTIYLVVDCNDDSILNSILANNVENLEKLTTFIGQEVKKLSANEQANSKFNTFLEMYDKLKSSCQPKPTS
ncbi:MAG: hypothetical protein KIT27_01850 [Legionellales bacterium]|nr:hypothetical protein [Legionellales bacterium]